MTLAITHRSPGVSPLLSTSIHHLKLLEKDSRANGPPTRREENPVGVHVTPFNPESGYVADMCGNLSFHDFVLTVDAITTVIVNL